jgi:hypothetical protein
LILFSTQSLDTWMPSTRGSRIKEIEMPSPSFAFEPPAYVARAPCTAPARAKQLHEGSWHDFEYHALLEEIRREEGEVVANPPLLFKIVVAVGLAMTAAGIGGLGLGVAHLAERLF